MKRTIEISASFTGTIPTGNYENEKPFYSVKEIMELEEKENEIVEDEFIANRQKELHQICYDQFKHQAEICKLERIAEEYKQIRLYDVAEGIKYPSVTSIIGWDSDFHMSEDELAQYASRGTVIHKQVEIFLKTGEWKAPKDIPEIYPDVVIVKKGNLGLSLNDIDFVGFYESYPFKVIELEKVAINHDKQYAGRLDIKCVIESSNKGQWEKIEGVKFDVPTILDVKTGTIEETRCFKQQTAYWHCEPDVEQVGLIHLNKKTKQGYSKPYIETDKEKYWHLFLKDREIFKQRFGI